MKVHVYNLADGETLPYSLPLVIGDVECLHEDSTIRVWLSHDPQAVLQWPVVAGCFKILVQLRPGQNVVNIRHDNDVLQLHLTYERPPLAHFVRPVYIVCADDDGYFQGPEDMDCSPESAMRRIVLGAQLIQSFTAEKMVEHGFGRLTFQLETGQDGARPVCHLFRTKLTLEQAYAMSGYDLWNHFAKELMTSNFPSRSKCKWYCFMSFTRYQPPPEEEIPKTHSEILKYTKGHTALGGGGLALFGTGNLHTWAPSLDTLHAHLTDRRKIDRRRFMDDSAYREYYWANYATGLGASLHELGHTFDLAHTATGIMARGFDDLHKVFTIQRLRGSRCSSVERQRYSSCSSSSNISRTPSMSSLDDGGPNGGSSVNSGGVSLDIQLRRYKDICYGSPFKRVMQVSRSSSSEQVYIPPAPLVVKVENAFKPVRSPSLLTFSVKNYDGSETHRTITQDPQGELITELTVGPDGTLLGSIPKERRPSSISNSSASSLSPSSSTPSTLPNSPEDAPGQPLPSVHFLDAGAHWARSSAVVLRYHRWLNLPDPNDNKKNPTLEGNHIKSPNGLRIIELRHEAEGLVFHHWEFLSDTPPTKFTLKRSRIKNLPENCSSIVLLAEDSYGNIMKKKLSVDKLELW